MSAAVRFGQYVLLRQIGRGGMGAVYQALHTRLERIVAIKMLVSDRMQDAEAVARFEREMRAVGRLEHPHIVRAMDAGEHEGVHYLVMEYVNGPDVSSLVSHHRQLPVAEACEIARQVALGLDYAFKRGLVHRDIKPSNVMISVGELPVAQASGSSTTHFDDPAIVRVLDFGLALLEDNRGAVIAGLEAPTGDSELTSAGQLMGTLDYIAPEQVGSSHDVDVRADLYSLGATLFKMLTGSAPHAIEKTSEFGRRIDAIVNRDAPPVDSLRRGLPPELVTLVSKLLQRDPQARLQTPMEVATALSEFTSGADLKQLALSCWKQKPISAALLSAPSVLAKMNDVREATLPHLPGSDERPIEPTTDRQRTAETGIHLRQEADASVTEAAGTQVSVADRGLHQSSSSTSQLPQRASLTMWLALPVAMCLAVAAYFINRPQETRQDPSTDAAQIGIANSLSPMPKVVEAGSSQGPDTESGPAVPPVMPKLLADVVAELKRLTPNFHGDVKFELDQDKVVALAFLVDDVTDLSPLRALRDLKQLDLRNDNDTRWDFPLRDLSPLSELKLETLNVSGTKIDDLTPLKGMPLKWLSVRGTPVSDLEPLRGKSIEMLDALYCPVRDFSVLSTLPLRHLECTINNLELLRGLSLNYFVSNGSTLNDLTPLIGQPIEQLWMTRSNLLKPEDFKPFTTVRVMNVAAFNGIEPSVLKMLPQLESLNGKTRNEWLVDEATPPGPSRERHPLEPQPRWPFDPEDGVEYVWSVPTNLGEVANTQESDILWGVSDDERTVYVRQAKGVVAVTREAIDKPFTSSTLLSPLNEGEVWGAVSPNGLHMMGNQDQSNFNRTRWWIASRTSVDKPFSARSIVKKGQGRPTQIAPTISADGLTLVFGAAGPTTKSSDLCLATRTTVADQFRDAVTLADPPSTTHWDMPFFISNDRCFLIASNQFSLNSKPIRRVHYFTRATAEEDFGPDLSLGLPIGAAEDSDLNGGHRITHEGRAIYFSASGVIGGVGQEDVWVCRREPLTEPVYLDDLQELEYFAHTDDTEPFPSGKTFGTHGLRHDAQPLMLLGRQPKHSVMLHPLIERTAYVSYDLAGQYSVLEGVAALADNENTDDKFAPITFRILGDGRELWSSRPMATDNMSQAFAVVVDGVQKLRLEVQCPGSNDFAHACWLEPRLRRRQNSPPLVTRPEIPPLKSGEWTDYTTNIIPALHANGGQWEVRDGALLLVGDSLVNNPRIRVPIETTSDYELQFSLTKTEGDGSIACHLPVGPSQCVVNFDGEWPGHDERVIGLQFLKQLRSFSDGNPTRRVHQLEPGRKYAITTKVQLQNAGNARIQLSIDNESLIDWTGPVSDLSADARWHRASPGFGSAPGVQAQIEQIRLRLP